MKQGPHILIIEDEGHLAVGIKYNLEAEGYQVTVRPDGPSALEYTTQNRDEISLVILDLMLPGMSGYQVCELLREQDHMMPVLILSARTRPEDRSKGFDAGADQYLTKPFELDELLSRVKNLLIRYRKSQSLARHKPLLATLRFGQAEVDFQSHTVKVMDKEVRMTQLELRLLEYFARHEGRVIPRGELLVEVWDMPASLNTRAPDQFIRRLRKRFESDPASPRHFLTIRDAGYRFSASGENSE